MKTARHYKFGNINNFNCSYNTIDKNINKSFYLSLRSWITPKVNYSNYNTYLSKLKNQTRCQINDHLSKNFSNRFILDFDVTYNSISYNHNSFLNIEVTVFPKEFISFESYYLKEHFYNICYNVTKKLNKNDTFSFNINKN